MSLSTWAGISPGARHYYCRLVWYSEHQRNEINAECGRGDRRTMRFDDEKSARAAGLRLARKLGGDGEGHGYYLVTLGSCSVLDPQEVLSAPGNLRARLNKLWRRYEKLYGTGSDARAEDWPALDEITDEWNRIVKAAEGDA